MRLRTHLWLLLVLSMVFGSMIFGPGVIAQEAVGIDGEIDTDLPIMYGTSGMIMDQVIVEFYDDSGVREAQASSDLDGVTFEDRMTSRPVARYTITDGSTPFQAITRLRQDTRIREVYPNYRRSVARTPNDPYFSLQEEELQVAQIPSAWDIETGSVDVLVGVIDTGVDYTHPDLIPNLVLPGINVREDDFPDEVMDDSGHGTAVCGIIGGVGNNGVGVAGVNWNVRILPIRACGGPLLDCDLFDEVEGIDVARESGCDIINLSIGGVGTISIEEEAVTAAYNAGIVIVAAAGNANPGQYYQASGDPEIDRHSLYYPAALPEVIGVGAVDNQGMAADFTNYGEDILTVMAPGVEIVTTVPEDEVYLYTGEGPPYGLASGTSFATPMVSGLAGLILAQYPGLGPSDVRARIENTCIPMAGPDDDVNGINDYYGHGIINAVGALGQAGTGGNNYLTVAVSASPIFAGEVFIMVEALSQLDSPPTVIWTHTESGGGGSVRMSEVPARPGFFIGTFAPDNPGNLQISVQAISGGIPLPSVSVFYILSD